MKSFKRCFFILMVFLNGCTVGPRYKEPALTLPSQYTSKLTLTNQEHTQLTSWWTQFEDPLLNVFIHEAISSNFQYQKALEKINEVRARYFIKAADLTPKIDLSAKERRSRISQNLFDSTFLGPPNQNFYEIGFDASWEIDFFGKRRREKEKAHYEYEASQEKARDIYITLLSEVARHYIEIRSLQHQIQLTKRDIYIEKELVSLSHSLLDAGLTSEIDPQEEVARWEALRAKITPLEASLQEKIHGLAILLGKTPETFGKELHEEAPIPLSSFEPQTGLPSDLLRRRPDIRQAERMLAAATAAVGSAVADLFPRFFLIGQYGYQSNESNLWFKPGSRSWTIGPDFQWPIIHFGRIRQNIRAQNSAEEQALLSYEETILKALEDVENALVGYHKEEERNKRLTQEVHAKRRIYDLKRDLYLSGLADFQTFLLAEQKYLNARLNLVTSDGDLSTKLVSLYKALGGEW